MDSLCRSWLTLFHKFADFPQTGMFFADFLCTYNINLTARQLYRDGGGAIGGGGGHSARFCVLISFNRWVRAARGSVAQPKPTSNAYVYVRKAKIAGCTKGAQLSKYIPRRIKWCFALFSFFKNQVVLRSLKVGPGAVCILRWYFWTFKEPRNRFKGIDYASLAGRYDNLIPTRFLSSIDCYKTKRGEGFIVKGYILYIRRGQPGFLGIVLFFSTHPLRQLVTVIQ
jgi:hypothetical protein